MFNWLSLNMSSEEIFTLRKIGDVWVEVIPSCFNLSLYQHRHLDYVISQLIDDKQLLDKEGKYRLPPTSDLQAMLYRALESCTDSEGYTTRIFYHFSRMAISSVINQWIEHKFPQVLAKANPSK